MTAKPTYTQTTLHERLDEALSPYVPQQARRELIVDKLHAVIAADVAEQLAELAEALRELSWLDDPREELGKAADEMEATARQLRGEH